MSIKTIRKAQQITVDEIATIAAAGVARALEARQAAGVELSREELSQVHGGLTLLDSTLSDSIVSGETWGMVPPPGAITV